MTKYGYVRKGFPTSEKDQLTGILSYGCDEVFLEAHSLMEFRELDILLSVLKMGDVLVVTNLKVFGKKFQGLRSLIDLCRDKQVQLISLEDQLDSNKAYDFFDLLDLLGRIDFACRSERTKQQIQLSREIGQTIGRPAIDKKKIERIYYLYHDKKWAMRKIATECDVSLGSVYKYIHQEAPCQKKESVG
ncbi:recombinase family protein [Vagococcus sp. BWB3-3]|uniref:Recombinase family protein n=1 Tax=Vagococcus allomyrinae TaxID=2794353 RepID=A0A940PDV5_9ENTE|nr:recombinase family protein [Vagococcus allomyrinae]MBP1042767.1 recombinase family protein [Vagococcus allomyrinae]